MPYSKSPWDQEFQAAVKPLARQTKTFTDERTGWTVTLTLEELDPLTLGVGQDLMAELLRKYVLGENGKPPHVLLMPTHPPRPVPMSREFCSKLAQLRAMERPEDGSKWPTGTGPTTDLDWVGIAVTFPQVWLEILEWATSLEADAGNSEAVTEAST